MAKKLPALLSGLLVSSAAMATTQTYAISGVMTDIRKDGAGIIYGTPFSATYTHSDSAQIGSLIEPGRIAFSGGDFTISAGSLNLASHAPTELQVFDSWSSLVGGYNNDDGFFVSSWVYDVTPGVSYLIQFDLWNFDGTTLGSLSVPSQPQFLQLSDNGRFWIRRFADGLETGLAQGGLQTISAIPEPTSAGLLLAGIGTLLLARRKHPAAA